ncbi:MAG: DUF2497 domain-containing protein [Alphaproteobacteria bacterium]|nr:DUF2497 domain-containing protein [Alphaproteobacteria bacterium]
MAAAKSPTPAPGQEDRLLSPATAEAVGGMFKQLADFRVGQRRLTEFPMGGQLTIEDVVRELLNPMVREWLDTQATSILERAVQSELARALGDVTAT